MTRTCLILSAFAFVLSTGCATCPEPPPAKFVQGEWPDVPCPPTTSWGGSTVMSNLNYIIAEAGPSPVGDAKKAKELAQYWLDGMMPVPPPVPPPTPFPATDPMASGHVHTASGHAHKGDWVLCVNELDQVH